MDGSDAPATYALDLVPREALVQAWPHVEARLMGMAARSGGEMTLESIAAELARKRWQLWLVGSPNGVVAGCVITHVGETDGGVRICEIMACLGEDATQWMHLLAEIEGWAKANGCVRVKTWARKGWAQRLRDYRLTHVLLEKDL